MPKTKGPEENELSHIPEPRREETEGTGARIDPRVEKERAPISPEEAMAELRKLFDDEDPPLESGRVR